MPVDPPGEYCSQLSLDPLKQLNAFMYKMEDYLGGLQAKYRAPVFRCHPGRRTVMLTDNLSGRFYFTASTDLLDREAASRVGCGEVGLTGDAVPLLVSRGERHKAGRAVMMDIFADRRASMWPSLDAAFESATSRWLSQGGFNIKLGVREFLMDAVFRWLLDTEISMFDVNSLHELCYFPGVWTDTLATKPVTRLLGGKFSDANNQARANYAKAVRESAMFERFQDFARDRGLPLDDFDQFVSSNMIGNVVGAPRLILVPAIARLGIEPELVDRLVQVRQGKAWTPRTLLEEPYLHTLFLETNRLYPRPRFMYKIAQQDFEVPAGDGRSYQIYEGDAVCVCFPQINRDPNVYARPDDFWPGRYEQNPELEEKLYLYSWGAGAKHPYGCASREGRQGEALVKYFFSRLTTEFQWEFAQRPVFDKNLYLEVGPVNLSATHFRRRDAAEAVQ
ncbi:MAG: cytochrome P450 [Myxococcales bacterium]|nr:cytochrome P450 [Myxococcales bacterium]